MKSESQRERVVVVGGGFAGLNFIKKIDKRRYDVTLVDRNNFHSFPPLFYQVASSGLDPASISFPFRREMSKRHSRGANYHMGTVKAIDFAAQTIETQFETIPYDRLVLAAGTTNNFFGNDELIRKVYTLKSTPEAIRVRNEILDRLERASVLTDPVRQRRLLSFVVIGGGPTGVEIAGAIGEMKRDIIKREYPTLSPEMITVMLVEGSDRLLRTMSPDASAHALSALKSLMVDVRLNTLMKSYDNGEVTFADGSKVYSEAVIWTAGITGVPFEEKNGELQRGPGGRILTHPNNRVRGHENVYALGDIAYTETEDYPHGFPQLAQVAIQQAHFLAGQFNHGFSDEAFEYDDKGSMATIGRNRAVADLGNLHLHGFVAWLVWMFIHLISLLGMRNKVTVLINWVWAYFTFNTSLRLLIHTTKYPLRRRWGE